MIGIFWLTATVTRIPTCTDKTYPTNFLHISSAWGRSQGEDLGPEHGLGPRQAEAHHRAREGASQVEGHLSPQPREVTAEPRQCAQCGNCAWRWEINKGTVVGCPRDAKMMIVFPRKQLMRKWSISTLLSQNTVFSISQLGYCHRDCPWDFHVSS